MPTRANIWNETKGDDIFCYSLVDPPSRVWHWIYFRFNIYTWLWISSWFQSVYTMFHINESKQTDSAVFQRKQRASQTMIFSYRIIFCRIKRVQYRSVLSDNFQGKMTSSIRPKYWLSLYTSLYIFGFSFVVWRCFFFTLLSHTSTPVSRFRFIDLDPAAVLVPVAFFFYILLRKCFF